MSNLKAEYTTDWADGTYTFRLTVPGAIELEQKCDAPFAVVNHRLQSGTYKIEDIRQTIRLGLIGGGKKPEEALRLVRQYVEERPLAESWQVARLIAGALMFGFEVAPLGKAEAAPQAPQSASTPPPSTATPASSPGSRLRTSLPHRFGNTRQQ
jgi:hypothetical protein